MSAQLAVELLVFCLLAQKSLFLGLPFAESAEEYEPA